MERSEVPYRCMEVEWYVCTGMSLEGHIQGRRSVVVKRRSLLHVV